MKIAQFKECGTVIILEASTPSQLNRSGLLRISEVVEVDFPVLVTDPQEELLRLSEQRSQLLDRQSRELTDIDQRIAAVEGRS